MDREQLARLAEVHPDDRAGAFAKARAAASDESLDLRAGAAEALAATGTPQEALAALEGLADDPAPGVRLAAVSAAAGLPWKGRVELLRRKLQDADRGIVLTSADGLAWAGEQDAAPVLRSLASDKRLRFEALEGLFCLADPSLVPIAEQTFPSFFAPHFEKALAAVVLAGRGDEKAKAFLRERLGKRRAEERPFIVIHLAKVDPDEGRKLIEAIARGEGDYLRESALLALARIDPSWWAPAQEAIGRWADEDPHVSAEVLLGLFEIDWKRASLIADAHVHRESELGAAARRLRLQSSLRDAFASEVRVR